MEYISKNIPQMMSVTLYNYNYIDKRIISTVKNDAFVLKKESSAITISANDLFKILKTKFMDDINNTSKYPQDRLVHGMTTAFQLYHLLNYYTSIKAVIINISLETDYTKIIDDMDGGKLLALDYRIEKGLIRYDDHFSMGRLRLFNQLLRDINIIETIRVDTYYDIYLVDYLQRIQDLNSNLKKIYARILEFNDKVFVEKLKLDNPSLTIITDHLKNEY